jgi:Icc protein
VTVVVAQMTDTHLRPPGDQTYGIDTGRALRNAVATITNSPVPVDVVVATGDLADHGDVDEYAYFEKCIAPIRAPVHAIPGNHDNGSRLSEMMAGKAGRMQAAEFCYAADVGPLRLVMLDTTVTGADHGSLGAARLAWLEKALSARTTQPTLLAMHHPPFRTGIPRMDAINLREGNVLGDLLGRHPQVIAIVCGHVHRSIFTAFADRPASIAPSPAYAVRLDFDDPGEIRVAVESPNLHLHVWSPDGGPFGTVTTHRVPISTVD